MLRATAQSLRIIFRLRSASGSLVSRFILPCDKVDFSYNNFFPLNGYCAPKSNSQNYHKLYCHVFEFCIIHYTAVSWGSVVSPVIQENGRLIFEDNSRPEGLLYTVNQRSHWACWQYGHSGGTWGWLGVERCQLCMQDTSRSTKWHRRVAVDS